MNLLFRSGALTVAHVISIPGSRSPAHNHRTCGVIGMYTDHEDNHLYRRSARGLEPNRVRSLRGGECSAWTPS